jgi:hypothetical protein
MDGADVDADGAGRTADAEAPIRVAVRQWWLSPVSRQVEATE